MVIVIAKHEFGIMPVPPCEGGRYDVYAPWQYNSNSVDDVYLDAVLSQLELIDFYWHTLAVKGKGLAYCGVTLIPPSSLRPFLSVIDSLPCFSELTQLFLLALREQKWVIHYGL